MDCLPPRRSSRVCSNGLRRSDLAGWRTRSLLPSKELAPNETFHSFLPVLKLRGLPYFCSKRHVLTWFGDLAIHILDLLFVAEVEPLNSGFALVTIDTPENALMAWRTLHKKPIVGKRFVEVFGLFPPHCPLSKRDKLPLICVDSETCPFCGFGLQTHSDGGAAALATARMRACVEAGALLPFSGGQALMHTAFLSVPALLYQDASAVSRSEVDAFDPEAWQAMPGTVDRFAEDRVVSLYELERLTGHPHSQPALFFDLMGIQGYDIRSLLTEVVQILDTPEPVSIATIGNLLSTKARAYLFIIEAKLRNVLEAYSDLFVVQRPSVAYGYFCVSLRREVVDKGALTIQQMEPFRLTKRRRQRAPNGERRDSDSLLQPLSPCDRASSYSPKPPLPRGAVRRSSRALGELHRSVTEQHEVSVALQDLIRTVSAMTPTNAPRPPPEWYPHALETRSVTCPGTTTGGGNCGTTCHNGVVSHNDVVSHNCVVGHNGVHNGFGGTPTSTSVADWHAHQRALLNSLREKQQEIELITRALAQPPPVETGDLGVFANDLEESDDGAGCLGSDMATASSLRGEEETHLIAKVAELLHCLSET